MDRFLVTFKKDNKFYDEVFVNADSKVELDLQIREHLISYHQGVFLTHTYEKT